MEKFNWRVIRSGKCVDISQTKWLVLSWSFLFFPRARQLDDEGIFLFFSSENWIQSRFHFSPGGASELSRSRLAPRIKGKEPFSPAKGGGTPEIFARSKGRFNPGPSNYYWLSAANWRGRRHPWNWRKPSQDRKRLRGTGHLIPRRLMKRRRMFPETLGSNGREGKESSRAYPRRASRVDSRFKEDSINHLPRVSLLK